MDDPTDKRADNLRQGADVIKEIAVMYCGIPVDDTTHERWSQMIGLLRDIDTFYDRPQGTMAGSMELLHNPASPFFERYPALFPDQIEPEAYHALLRRARSIMQIGQFATETTDLEHFIAYRKIEAKQVAGLFFDSAAPSFRRHHAFSRSFVPLAHTVAISGNFYDSFVDGRRDFKEGRLRVTPNREFYKRVGMTAFSHTVPALGVVLYPSVTRQLFVMAKNRLTNKMLYDDDG